MKAGGGRAVELSEENTFMPYNCEMAISSPLIKSLAKLSLVDPYAAPPVVAGAVTS